MPGRRTVCVSTPWQPSAADTFIRAHMEHLPARIIAVHGWRPSIGTRTVLSTPRLVLHKLRRVLTRGGLERETTAAYQQVFREFRVDAVLAEYGDHAVWAVEACRRSNVPLIAHFHGYDASVYSVLEENAEGYANLFAHAAAIIVVSQAMRQKLLSLGAKEDRVYLNPYGVDSTLFSGADPAVAPPVALAVGRFVEKKAPQKTLEAFASALRAVPSARLRMVGDGPLLAECRQLAVRLGIDGAVTFLGAQSHDVIRDEMRRARCFVQHSVVAPSGDSEGTPVAIIEASATGLPIVATRHAGIPDVVVEGETGFLVAEGDVASMADSLRSLFSDASLAGRMGAAGRARVEAQFSMDLRIRKLWAIISDCIDGAHLASS